MLLGVCALYNEGEAGEQAGTHAAIERPRPSTISYRETQVRIVRMIGLWPKPESEGKFAAADIAAVIAVGVINNTCSQQYTKDLWLSHGIKVERAEWELV
jgi:hypothetical protein